MVRQTLGQIGLVLLLVVISGCGPTGAKLARVKGKVLYKGQPIAGASVTFQPATGPMAVGTTDPNGEFTLTTSGRPGAAPGDHKVSISKLAGGAAAVDYTKMKPEDMMKMAQEAQASGGSASYTPKNELPEKYRNAETSGLSATVSTSEADNVFEFPLLD